MLDNCISHNDYKSNHIHYICTFVFPMRVHLSTCYGTEGNSVQVGCVLAYNIRKLNQ